MWSQPTLLDGVVDEPVGGPFVPERTDLDDTSWVDLCRGWLRGADHALDYTVDDPLATRGAYDVMLDIAGQHPLLACRGALKPTGTYVLIGGPKGRLLGPIPRLVRAMALSLVSSQRLVPMLSTENAADLAVLRDHLADGTIRPVIGATVALDEAGAALDAIGRGHTTGKTVVVI